MIHKEKISQAINFLKETDIDLWIILVRETTMMKDPILPLICDMYFSGMGAIIVEKAGRAIAITSYLERDSAKQTELFDDVLSYNTSFENSFKEYIGENSSKKIALNYSSDDPSADGLTYGMYMRFTKLLKKLDFKGEIVSSENILSELRSVKNKEETELIIKSIKLAEKIFEEAKDFIKVGITEREIFDFFQQKCKKYETIPSWELSQCPGVSVYPDTPSGHCGPTDIPVKKGSLIGIDFGVVYGGYCSDLQRMYYILNDGETDAPTHIKDAFYAVRDTIAKAMECMRHGVTGNQLDTMSREYLAERGYTDWPHSLGHQVGLYVHDGGAMLSKRKENNAKLIDTPLKNGFVFAIEPATYLKEGCICIEEMVCMMPDGTVFISDAQQELFVLRG